MAGTLYIIPTPIGNREDITLRALNTLKIVDAVAAEDSRHTGQLLAHYNIKKPFISYHEHNESIRIPQLIEQLKQGQSIGLTSDAGTPTISDPGYKLIRQAAENQINIEVLPGASAILVALAGSGLPTDKFYFGGFLPKTSGKQEKVFAELKDLPATLIFFESPFRVGATLANAVKVLGNRNVVIARELTKIHQQYWRGTTEDAIQEFSGKKTKGEIVILFEKS